MTMWFRRFFSRSHSRQMILACGALLAGGVHAGAPVITSTGPTSAPVNTAYTYQVVATDPEGTALTYTLPTAPAGMAIDASTGLINWTPVRADGGLHIVKVVVTDAENLADTQFTYLSVTDPDNQVPVTGNQTPATSTVFGSLYSSDLQAGDGDIDGNGDIDEESNGDGDIDVEESSGDDDIDEDSSDDDDIDGESSSDDDIDGESSGDDDIDEDSSDDDDIDDDSTLYSLYAAPGGMTIDASSGLVQWMVQWTPTTVVAAPGKWAKIQANNGYGSLIRQDGHLTGGSCGNNTAPVITSTAVTSAQENSAYRYPVIATDAEADPLIFTLSGAPTGMSIDVVSGIIDWTPHYSQSGEHAVTVVVNDGLLTDTQHYTVTVANTNRPPAITSTAVTSVNESATYTYAATASDPDSGDTLSWRLASAPGGMTIDASTGIISWSPGATGSAQHPVTVIVSDNHGAEDSQHFTLSVLDINHAPVASDATITLDEDSTIIFALNASDPDGDNLTLNISSAPAHGTAVLSGTRVTYTPDARYSGTDTLQFIANDGQLNSAVATVTFTINPVNHTPQITSAPVTGVTEGQAYQYNVTAIDSDGDALSYALSNAPAGMTISPMLGTIDWAPTQQDVGAHAISITVTDAPGAAAEQHYTLTVSPRHNNAPVITSRPVLSVQQDSAYSYDVDATDADNHALSYQLDQAPAGMSISVLSGIINWQPAYVAIGTHTVNVRVTDIPGAWTTQTYLLTVTPRPNQAPQITSTPVTGARATELYSYIVTATDADNDPLLYSLPHSPAGMNIHPVSGLISWIPGTSQSGAHAVRVRVDDQNGATAEQTWNITVTQNTSGAPVISTPPVTVVNEHSQYRYTMVATDPDDDPLNWHLTTAPAGLTINPVTGTINGFTGNTQVQSSAELLTQCTRPPANAALFSPVLKWARADAGIASVPLVAPLFDSNTDGVIDSADASHIIIASYTGSANNSHATLSALRADNGTRVWAVTDPALATAGTSHRAIGDIDGDGVPEIVMYLVNGGIAVINNDGTLKWQSTLPGRADPTLNHGSIALADIDADGQAEILARNYVLNANGTEKWHTSLPVAHSVGAFAADLNGDGQQEVIIGHYVFNSAGTLLWQGGEAHAAAIGNFDADPQPEIVMTGPGGIQLFEHDGTLIWQVGAQPAIPTSGAPAVVNLDNDRFAEVIALHNGQLTALDHNGTVLWAMAAQSSTYTAGVSVFDFDNDGFAEVLFTDETTGLRVLDSRTGRPLWHIDNPSTLATQYPVMADLDHDRHAELLLVSDNNLTPGLRVYRDINNAWSGAGPLWSQYHYHIDNITPALGIPASPAQSWQTHNTFRANSQPVALADLRVGDILYHEATQTLSAVISNRGVAASTATTVSLYSGTATGTLLGSVAVPALQRAESHTVQITGITTAQLAATVTATVNSDQSPEECGYDNNTGTAQKMTATVTDPQLHSDSQTWLLNIHNVNDTPGFSQSLQNSHGVTGQLINLSLSGQDNDVGDALNWHIVSGPAGATISPTTGELHWVPGAGQTGVFTMVISVTDLAGASTQQNVDITISANLPPVIVSTPSTHVSETALYSTDVDATDPNPGDTVRFNLIHAPAGVRINTLTGMLESDGALTDSVQPVAADLNHCEVPYSPDLLTRRVETAVKQGADYLGRQTIQWNWSNKCLGCHIQTQGLFGMASSAKKVAVDPTVLNNLENALSTALQNDGGIYNSHTSITPTQNTLAIWAMTAISDADYLFRTKYLLANAIYPGRTETANGTYWTHSRSGYNFWWSKDIAYTAITTIGFADLITASRQINQSQVNDYSVANDFIWHSGATGTTTLIDTDTTADGKLYSLVELNSGSASVYQLDLQHGALQVYASGLPAGIRGFTVADNGLMYLALSNSLVRVNLDGTQNTLVSGTQTFWDVELSHDGQLYVSDSLAHAIAIYSTDGTPVKTIALNEVSEPRSLSIAADNTLYVAEVRTNNPSILKIDPRGHVTTFVDGLPGNPVQLKMNTDGTLWVTARRVSRLPGADRLYRVDEKGRAESVYTSNGPTHGGLKGISIHGGQVRIVDNNLTQLQRINQAPMDLSLLPQFEAVIDSAAQYLLSTYDANTVETDNIFLAMRVLGLAAAAKTTQNATLRSSITTTIVAHDTLLRSRQNVDGGWGRSVGDHSDPLVTAAVGLALDEHNPLRDDPVVINAINYLLSSQEPLGDWKGVNNGLLSDLSATGLVMAYLPVALSHVRELPDMSVLNPVYDQNTQTLSATVRNRGTGTVNSPALVQFYNGDPQSGTLLGGTTLPSITAGQQTNARLTGITPDQLTNDIHIVIDAANTIDECKTDNNTTRASLIKVRATDTGGLYDQQTYLVYATDENSPPRLNLLSPGTVTAGELFEFQPTLIDDDRGDGADFTLLGGPGGLISTHNGLLSWQTSATDVGRHVVTLQVTDLGGASDQQSFTINVVADPNNAPVITSTAPLHASVDIQYNYQVTATDADSDALSYQLAHGPTGASIDTSTGLITWLPDITQLGNRHFIVQVQDSRGKIDRQFYTVEVISPANLPPVINSVPAGLTLTSLSYEYLVVATDPENALLNYSLLAAPAGITLDTSTGLLQWTNPVAGFHYIALQVDDGLNRTQQTFVLRVLQVLTTTPANVPPSVISSPVFTGLENQPYQYQLTVTDPDDSVFTYALTSAPPGMSISSSGLITWTPQTTAAGNHNIVISISDAHNNSIQQAYELYIGANTAPVFTSTPVVTATTNAAYGYQPVVTDQNGDTISYTLHTRPAGMTINSATGLINWTPASTQNGIHTVTLVATDSNGHSAQQHYNLSVTTPAVNEAPRIVNYPSTTAIVAVAYRSVIEAIDADGDTLNYTLQTAPAGMRIDNTGAITWLPASTQTGSHDVTVRIDDSQTYIDIRYEITVDAEAAPLQVSISASPHPLQQGQSTTITVTTTGGIAPATVTLTANGQPLTLTDGSAVFTSNTIGRHTLTATATDGSSTTTEHYAINVIDPADTVPPVVHIHTPLEQTPVTASTALVATITDSNLVEYRVYLAESDGSHPRLLTSGTRAVTAQTVATLDPSLIVNGQYTVVIQADDSGGQTTSASTGIIVEGDLKVGHFSFTVEDLNIPLAGIPLSVRRTYDSRRRHEALDFGYGWSIDYQNVKLHESRTPGAGWALNQYSTGPGGVLQNYCVEPLGAPLVTVTLPDGNVERFRAAASPRCNVGSPFLDVALVFEAEGNTGATLEPLSVTGGRLNNGHLVLLGSPDPINPDQYRLTTRAGYTYTLDQHSGITRVETPNGHTLTYSDSGIVHSGGKSILFTRDSLGRITAITDPAGQTAMHYRYSSTGDLAAATDSLNAETTYRYNRSHGLLAITDPLNRPLLRNLYDNDGRLIAQEDGAGNRTDFTHDLPGRQSVITDRNHHTTVLYYDERGNVTSQVDALGHTSQFTYDARGNQLTHTDPLGHTRSATFNERNDQLTQTDALGHTVTFAYNPRGQETRITDARGNTFSNTYDSVGNLLSVTDPQGHIAGNNINAQGLVSSTTDVLGHTTSYTYDSDGNRLTETDSAGNVTTRTYDANANVLTESRTRTVNSAPVTETTTYTYDSRNRLLSTTDAQGHTTTVEYNLAGQQTARIDALNRRTTMSYDAYGNLLQTTYPDGTTSSSTYDAENNRLTDTDRAGRTTTYSYDALNRLTQTTYADGSTTATAYDSAGRVISETDANGHTTVYEYDTAGRRTLRRNAQGHEHHFEYDADGNLTAETDALGRRTTYSYNSLDQKTQTTFTDTSTLGDTLDALSRRTAQTDQAGVSTGYSYDTLGRLTRVTNALNQVTTFTYDEAGNKRTQTDAAGRTTTWTYDSAGRVLTRTLPLGQQESFTHDANGNVLIHTDFNGQSTTHTYDTNDRLTGRSYSDGRTESFTYDHAGNRTSAVVTENATTRTTAYQYDNRDRLIRTTWPDGSTVAYSYDPHGNRTGLTTTRGASVTTTTFTYDTLNRLSSATDAQGTTTYSYDAVGNRTGVSYPNGDTHTYSYDTLNRLTQVQIRDAQGTLTAQYDYTLHATGRRTRIDELNNRSTSYSFDTLYRLTGETVTENATTVHSASYQYDAVGNRTYETVNGVQTAYTVDNNDRLIQQGGTAYTYDNNGNTLTETTGGNTISYTYDAKNTLQSRTENGVTTTYTYNADGIRTSKTQGATTTDYLIDDNRDYAQVLEESQSGARLVRYHYGDDLISQDRSGIIRYYHMDGLGSVRSLSDPTGNITDTVDYTAFGEILNQTGSTENNYWFAGEQLDAESGNYYLRARYMNPNTGTFLTLDTWMGINHDPITLHKYLYANADPGNMIDPTGNFSIGSVMSAVNTVATLATRAQSAYNLFQVATGEQELSAKQIGFEILAGMGGGKLIKMFSKKFKKCRVGNSFTEGTLVSTPDGLVPIESVKIGDLVYSYDEQSGEVVAQEVIHLIQGDKEHEIVTLDIAEDESIRVTGGHPFYVAANDDKWISAENIQVGDELTSSAGKLLPVAGLNTETSKEKVYNLTVANTHTYYVGEQQLLAHNSTCRLPHRARPQLEQGDLRKGWLHIKARHIDGNHPTKGAGDLFPRGTTFDQVVQVANKVVAKGKRLSDPSKQIQVFQHRARVNGQWSFVCAVVDSDNGNNIVSVFPALTSGKGKCKM